MMQQSIRKCDGVHDFGEDFGAKWLKRGHQRTLPARDRFSSDYGTLFRNLCRFFFLENT
jgi:hypothetical protein